MPIDQGSNETTVACAATPVLVPYNSCAAQGLKIALPSTASEGLVLQSGSTTSLSSLIAEILPGETIILPIRNGADASTVYGYTRGGATVTAAVAGVL